jgi:hypothetical protein
MRIFTYANIWQGGRLAIAAGAAALLGVLALMPEPAPMVAVPTERVPVLCQWYPGRDSITTPDGHVVQFHCPRWWLEMTR